MDSYFYYAPYPRVVKLKKVLRRAKIKPRTLLVQQPLINPNFVVNKLVWLQGAVPSSTAICNIPRGSKVRVTALGQQGSVGEENAAFIDFLVFLLRDVSRASEKLRRGLCPKSDTVLIGKKLKRKLNKIILSRDFSDLRPLFKSRTSIGELYSEFMVCRAAKILGVKYPDSIERVSYRRKKNDSRLLHFLKNYAATCIDVCSLGEHWEDIGRALALHTYVTERDLSVYVATQATLKPRKEKEECFSCILAALVESTSKLIHLMSQH